MITRKVVIVTALLVACASDAAGPPAAVATVSVTATTSTVPVTGTVQLTAVTRDASGNTLSGRAVTWSSDDETVAGVSTAGLVTGRSLGTVTITATAEGHSGTIDMTVVVGPAARLSFIAQPSGTTSGATIAPAVQVEVQDAAGNRVTGAGNSITIGLGANPKHGSLVGTTTLAATGGVATFSNLTIDSAATGYSLTAAAVGLTGATSGAFDITVGAAARLGFLVQPGSTTGGATITPAVQVEIRDAGGNRVTTATTSVTVAIGANPKNGTLGGTASAAAVNGVASFTTLTIDSAGTAYTLIANATGLAAATSASFDVAVGPAEQLEFLVQPTNTAGGTAVTPAVQVEVRDAGGNRVTTATTSITLAIGTNPSGGTLSGGGPIAAVGGVATFPSVSIDKDGSGYTLTAAGGGLAGTTSTAFNIAVGGAVRLAFFVQPSNTSAGTAVNPAVQVEVQDAGGNRVTGASNDITLALGANPKQGSLAGTTTVAAANGVATFSNLRIDSAATGYTLTAAATGLTGATSGAFDISVGGAAKVGFLVQPGSTTGGATITPAVQVEIRDAGGNRVTTATNSVTVAIGTNPNGGSLGGTRTIAAVNGVASFATLAIDSAGTGYTLSATASGLTGATSSAFNISVGSAATLGFRVQPTNAASGVAINPAVQVEVRDAGGNRVTTATTNITLAIGTNPSGGTLSGTTPKAAVNGVATFADLSIDKNGTGYTLTASGAGLAGATSDPFDIAVGGATKLVFFVQPTSTTGGAAISPSVQVEIQDGGGNRVTTASTSITIALGANPKNGSLGGTTTRAAASGLATFNNLTIDSAATGYTLTAAATGLTGATSSSFNITVGAATKLGFLVQPASGSGGATIGPAVQVEIRDAGGNRVTSATNSVTVAIGANPNSGTLSGTKSVAAASGVAGFATLSIDSAGAGYTLTANASGLTAAISASFDITVGPAVRLGFRVEPVNTAAGVAITPAVQIEVRDSGGNRVTTANSSIMLTLGVNPKNGALGGTTTRSASSGLATFNNLTIDSAATGYTLVAAATSLAGVTSSAFNITVGVPSRLAFRVQPANGTGGAVLSPAVEVEVRDAGGNRVTTATNSVTMAIGTNPNGGALGGTKTVGAVNGIASFNTLTIDSAATGYTLGASASGLTGATSSSFNIAVGPAAKLGFLVQPSNAASGAAITPAVQVEVRDLGGNRVTANTSITLAIGNNPSGGVLSGLNPKAAVNGVATFSDLSIDKSGTGYTLTAAGGGFTGATSAGFNITGGPPDHLGFFVQPSNATAGSAITPAVQVEVLDASGNRVTSDTRSITVAILDNPSGGILSGTKTVAAVAGVASFSGLSIDKAGSGYTLLATSSPALSSASSADFNIAPASPSRAHFFVEPSSATAGVAITPDLQVEILDAFGNRVGTASNSVTVALLANPGSGTLSGTKTRNASAGVATFPGLSINKAANGYTIRATSSGLASDTSVVFNITPGPASQLVFTTPPANTAAGATMSTVVVTARDAQGNTATGFTGDVSIAIGTNPGSGTLSGTLDVPAASGVATFSNLSIDKVGSGYTLTASATGPAGATSGTFNITVGAAAKLAFAQQPTAATGGATISPAVTVRILDGQGNLTSSTATVTLALTAGTGTAGALLGGTVSRAAVAGVATFSNLNVDSVGTAYTLNAISSGLTADTSSAFNVAVGAPARLTFLVQPSTTSPGATITPAVQVDVRDAGGNRVTTDNATDVTVAIGSGSGTLSGTLTQQAAAGVATFSNLSINNAGTYTLTANAPSLGGATSNSFDIVVGTATKLAFFVAPSSTTGGATISPAVQVEIQDAGSNRVTTATNSVVLAFGANPKNGHLSGTTTVAAVNGVATFDDVSIDSAATGYTLSATSSGLTGVSSNAFDITVGAATKLGLRVQPSSTPGGADITPAVQVEVRDAGGNRVTTASNSITMAIGTNPNNGTLSGTTSLAAVSGAATFSTLRIDSAGTGYRLSATASGLTGATSNTFDVTVGAAAKLGYLVQPSDAAAGSSIAPAVTVEIRDDGGNRVTTATNDVTVAIGANPGGGTLGGATTVAAVGGVATFSDLNINKTGAGYTLAATAASLTSTTSAGFDITAAVPSGSLSTLVAATDTIGQCAFSCVPGIRASTVTVTVKDQFGNLVGGAPVILSGTGAGSGFAPSATGNTNASGVFTAAFNSSDFGAQTVSATASGVGINQTAAVAVMPVLVGAGDIADCNSVRDDATANQLDSIPGVVFAAGDNAYANGTTTNFTNCYDPTWGRHKARTKPVIGNHEYDSSGTAAGHFAYFTPAVADPLGNGYGYYSFDLGTWHVVVLNSDSGATNPVSGPAQLGWLQSDLVGRTNQCVLAIWHRPLFTSGSSGGAGSRIRRLWQTLENAGAEIVINGHDHLYERFAPQDSLGNANSAGIREFIVGTGGGETHTNYISSPPNVEASDIGNFSRGVLRLTFYANSYRWEFLPAQGQGTFTDSGTQACH